MDRLLARRLDDTDFHAKALGFAKGFVQLGIDATAYWQGEWDAAYDTFMCYAPMTKTDFEKLESGHPKRWVLPVAATQISTVTTFVAQTLFGDSSPFKVEGRGGEDQVPAEMMNQVLRWNSDQTTAYARGFSWVQDCLLFNRGIFYNSYETLTKSIYDYVPTPDPEEIDEATGLPVFYPKLVKKKVVVGGYNKLENVSPYDFFCDPSLPTLRFQEMRFCGHRTVIPWHELSRRSKLSQDDPAYVRPEAVEKLKFAQRKPPVTTASSVRRDGDVEAAIMSRTAYERTAATNGTAVGATGRDRAGKQDPGVVDVTVLYVRMTPEEADLDPNADEEEQADADIYQWLIGNGEHILSVHRMGCDHDMFPYGVAEARPDAHRQYTPSWMMILRPAQNAIDYLRTRHEEALSRTVGNVFIVRSDQVNMDDFMDPKKEGKVIPVLPGADSDLNNVIRQVPIKDLTENFPKEMANLVSFSETICGATSQMQGQAEGDSSATEFVSSQQMAAGRMSSVARLLSVQGLVPITKQWVSNFQQFMDPEMELRVVGESLARSSALRGHSSVLVSRDTIQGEFDFIPHDGSLPGTDSRMVAALTRALEASVNFPQVFTPQPGNLNPTLIFTDVLRRSGVAIDDYVYREDDPEVQAAAQQPAPPPGPMMGAPGVPTSQQGAQQPPGPPPGQLPNLGGAPGANVTENVGGGLRMPQLNIRPNGPSEPRPM